VQAIQLILAKFRDNVGIMDKDKKENPPKTFAEKMNEHTKSNEAMLNKVSRLLSQVRKTTMDDNNCKEKERLIERTEKYLKLVEKTMLEFETNHEKELRALELYLKNNSE